MKVAQAQTESTVSGWFATLDTVSVPNCLDSEISYDYLVIGAGWMGLHVARRLAELDPFLGSVILSMLGVVPDLRLIVFRKTTNG